MQGSVTESAGVLRAAPGSLLPPLADPARGFLLPKGSLQRKPQSLQTAWQQEGLKVLEVQD